MTESSNNKTEISIIIPLYNKEKYIKCTIDSVLLQSYPYFELIIVDDGSTDSSVSVVESIQDKRIKLYKKTNGGVSVARNQGIKKAIGEWIVFLDADDELAPNALVGIREIIEKHQECAVIVAEEFGFAGDRPYRYKKVRKLQYPLFLAWIGRLYARPGALFIKRSILDAKYDERMSFFEDYLFMLQILKSHKVLVAPITTVNINSDPCSLSKSVHPLNKEMAYYIPEILAKGDTTFWERALLYENIEQEIAWWQGNDENIQFYRDMQRKHFAWYYKYLHWLRQQLKRHGMI